MDKKIAVGMCGSFCNHSNALETLTELVRNGYEVYVFLTQNVDTMTTKFGNKDDLKELIYAITNKVPSTTLQEAELLVNQKCFDQMLILPCSASTLAKLVHGIYDNSVLMCAKSLLRNDRPICLAIASNDMLGISGENLMKAINYKNIFVVPLRQDNYLKKPHSMVYDQKSVLKAVDKAYEFKQMQPIFLEAWGE